VGSALKIEIRLEQLGENLRRKFGANQEGTFVEGFVSSSLLFVIGPLAILGSISDGMGTGIDQLSLKSILDFFAAIAFAASLGWGVAASSIPVGIYSRYLDISWFCPRKCSSSISNRCHDNCRGIDASFYWIALTAHKGSSSWKSTSSPCNSADFCFCT